MKTTLSTIAILLLGALIGFSLGYSIYSTDGEDAATDGHFRYPSVTEFQEQLNKDGYPVTVDGVIGPETIKAWDDAWTEQEFGN